MRATVEAATDFQRQPDAETTAEKSGVTLKYEEMLAALEGLMAEMREETPQADASGKVVDQPSEERTTARPKRTPRSPRNNLPGELMAAAGQVGALRPAQARSVVIRHPGAMHF